jgi:HAD superfamily hydrolase (TIGR01509 family)
MIDTIIFDLDGVLIVSKDIHFNALNKSIKKTGINYQINYTDHLNKFDGLPTITKLEILNKENLVNKKYNKKIILEKKKITKKEISSNLKYNKKIFEMFQKLSKKYKLGIATNAIQDTLDQSIKKLKLKKFIKSAISTKQIKSSKPSPEIYLRSMINLGSNPRNTLILEDSHVGRSAAKDSGAKLMPVKNIDEVSYENIINFIKEDTSEIIHVNNSWEDNNLNVVIPMAGEGSRFVKAGYSFPKPLIEVNKKPMIQTVKESLGINGQYIFLVRGEHLKKYNLNNFLKILAPNCKIIVVDKLTEGAACTVMLAKKYIDNDRPLIIANADQYIEWNPSETMYRFTSQKIDGGILTFNSIHPKWSYAKTDKDNKKVIEVAEKNVISNNATVGVYYWRKGSDFVKYTDQMISNNIRINNEFYVCPVFNQAIKDNKIIKISKVDSMWGLGTPEDLKNFVDNCKTE